MRRFILVCCLLGAGLANSALAQAPAGYVSLEEVDIEPQKGAVAPVIGTKPAAAAEAPAAAVPGAEKPGPSTATAQPAAGAGPVVATQPAAQTNAAVPAAATETPAALQAGKQQSSEPAAVPAKPVFQARAGASLRDTLQAWAQQAGWTEVAWKLPEDVDFTLGMNGTYEGDFMAATRAFIEALGCEAELRVLFNQKAKIALVEPV